MGAKPPSKPKPEAITNTIRMVEITATLVASEADESGQEDIHMSAIGAKESVSQTTSAPFSKDAHIVGAMESAAHPPSESSAKAGHISESPPCFSPPRNAT